MMERQFSLDFPFAWGQPKVSAGFRIEPEGFQVDEELGFALTGEGEHVYVQLRKRNANTAWVAEQLAGFAGISATDVGYAGRKDRRAVTSQWFSLYLPGRPQPDWSSWSLPGVERLASGRHNRKLRPGDHSGNRFVIRLRDVTPVDEQQDWRPQLEARLEQIRHQGVPNYFGEQRFGREGNNLRQLEALVSAARTGERARGRKGRSRSQAKGMLLSAARSWLFNLVLAERVATGCWQEALPGQQQNGGPLWGRGRPLVEGECLALENRVLEPWRDWLDWLEHQGLQQERRPLQLLPKEFRWQWQERDLLLSFELSPGQFATALLRELAQLQMPEAADAEGVSEPETVL